VSVRKDRGPRPFDRVLIANRGEIAVRIARTLREMDIESVAVYSDADGTAVHVEAADIALRIGPASAAASYLNIPALLEAARSSGAEAVHPGYGFLSENPSFARAVEEAGLVWIGPSPDTQELLGNKLAARRAVADAGVPIVPGLLMPLGGDSSAESAAVRYPAMLKAAAGGGGRGMRRVEGADQLASVLGGARREAEAAFGDPTLYLEELIEPARHVEVQLLGDRHGNLVCLGERDCSIQRRHQKLVEESPSPVVDSVLRDQLFDSARRVAGTVAFQNAATVEFLVDAEGGHYFLEMNTRLQVEHGVTELVTGLDLVAWQILVAAGEQLSAGVLGTSPRGHAIEVRVYAEDPYAGFRPVGGTVTTWRLPAGPGVRVDEAVRAGLPLTPEYDPLLAKVMSHAADRPAAVARLRRALDEMLVGGLQTDLGFHRWLVDDPGFVAGAYDTGFVATQWRDGPVLSPEDVALVGLAAREARSAGSGRGASAGQTSRPVLVSDPRRPGDAAWARLGRQEGLR
jgi:acetyl-CoA/propionyl-CoA carboxylase, biotin carboxylase, biotin carboxyl carrier protein